MTKRSVECWTALEKCPPHLGSRKADGLTSVLDLAEPGELNPSCIQQEADDAHADLHPTTPEKFSICRHLKPLRKYESRSGCKSAWQAIKSPDRLLHPSVASLPDPGGTWSLPNHKASGHGNARHGWGREHLLNTEPPEWLRCAWNWPLTAAGTLAARLSLPIRDWRIPLRRNFFIEDIRGCWQAPSMPGPGQNVFTEFCGQAHSQSPPLNRKTETQTNQWQQKQKWGRKQKKKIFLNRIFSERQVKYSICGIRCLKNNFKKALGN